ncbi:hypothetical protein AZH11_12825 [Pseudomonas simiae]|nr:hypothetical protein AZH11_12825 [Pseudomonas simiae]
MPHDDCASASIHEHLCADVASKRAADFGAAILPTDGDTTGSVNTACAMRVAGRQIRASSDGSVALTDTAIASISLSCSARPFIFQFPTISCRMRCCSDDAQSVFDH